MHGHHKGLMVTLAAEVHIYRRRSSHGYTGVYQNMDCEAFEGVTGAITRSLLNRTCVCFLYTGNE